MKTHSVLVIPIANTCSSKSRPALPKNDQLPAPRQCSRIARGEVAEPDGQGHDASEEPLGLRLDVAPVFSGHNIIILKH
jgi:hypothetical protein